MAKNKKDRVYYKSDSLVDFKGNERKFTVAAVTETIEADFFDEDDYYSTSFGLSVIRDTDLDNYDEALAKTIALGKAKKDKTIIGNIATYDKILTKKSIIEAYLDAFVTKIKQDPGEYIAGYNPAKRKAGL